MIIVEAIKTSIFLNDERPQKGKVVHVSESFFCSEEKDKVKINKFVEQGSIGFVARKRKKTKKSENKGAVLLMVKRKLDHPSRSRNFYNPSTRSILISDSFSWNDFKPW